MVNLPQSYVDTTMPDLTGDKLYVNAGDNLQNALNTAMSGDTIVLEAGASFVGPLYLPKRSDDGWVVITSSNEASLPPQGVRMAATLNKSLPKIIGPSGGPAIASVPAAHHYRFINTEFMPSYKTYNYGLALLGSGVETNNEEFPHHIILDRCYVHGDPVTGGKRGVMFAGSHLAVIDSYLSYWKGEGQDTQAICGWTGHGPWKVTNNYLEGAGENLMVGGADPSIINLSPSDIEIKNNFFCKPSSWNPNHSSYDGSNWSVKNLLELKNCKRALISNNTFKNCWVNAQMGHAILFSVMNQDGTAPWSTIEDVTFTDNTIDGAARGLTLSAYDGTHPSGSVVGKRFLIKHNRFLNIGGPMWGPESDGWLFLMLSGGEDVTIEHNTGMHTGSCLVVSGTPFKDFSLNNNVMFHNQYGIKGDDMGVGNSTIQHYFPNSTIKNNMIIGADPAQYPSDNFYPSSAEEAMLNSSGKLSKDSKYVLGYV